MALIRMKDYPRLGSLIFGEGVLNDVISIVLFKSFLTYIEKSASPGLDSSTVATLLFVPGQLLLTIITQVAAAIFIGFMSGLAMSRFLKLNPSTRRHPIHQTSLVFLVGLLSYGLAECFEVSGILTIFVTAVTMAHYSWFNLSKSAQITSKLGLSAISDIAEGFAFAYVGLSLWEYTSDRVSLLFSLYMLVVLIVGRMICVFGICFVCRNLNDDFKLPLREQVAFVLAGLVRGCLCWAQATQVSQFKIMVTTTLLIVMTTSVVSGFLYPAILPMLVPQSVNSAHATPSVPVHQRVEEDVSTGLSESSLQQHNKQLADANAKAIANATKPGHSSTPTPAGDSRFGLALPVEEEDDRESTYSQHAYDTPDTEDVRPWRYQSLGGVGVLPPPLHGALSRQTSSFRVSGAPNGYGSTSNSLAGSMLSKPNTSRPSMLRSQSIRDPNFNITETYSTWYVKWLRFDYLVMKPLFGGNENKKSTIKKVAVAVSEKDGSVHSGSNTVALGPTTAPVVTESPGDDMLCKAGNREHIALSNYNVLSPITNYTVLTTSSPRHTPLPQLQRSASSRRETNGSVQDRDMLASHKEAQAMERFLAGINQQTLTQLPIEAIADIVSIEEQWVDNEEEGVLEEEDPFVQALVDADEGVVGDQSDEFDYAGGGGGGGNQDDAEAAFGTAGQLASSVGRSEISPLLRPHLSSQQSQSGHQYKQYYQSMVHSPVQPKELALLTPIAEETSNGLNTPFERYGT